MKKKEEILNDLKNTYNNKISEDNLKYVSKCLDEVENEFIESKIKESKEIDVTNNETLFLKKIDTESALKIVSVKIKNPKEYIEDLIQELKPLMYCYSESGMLTNDIDDDIAISFAKRAVLIFINKVIETEILIDEDTYVETPSYLQYWIECKKETEKYKNTGYNTKR